MSTFWNRIRSLDAYTKPLDDFKVKTLTGGAVTLLSAAAILVLFISETWVFLSPNLSEELFVDSTAGDERLDIHFDVFFPRLPCPFISIDVMDVSGEAQNDINTDVYKLRLDKHGLNLTGETPIKQEVNAGNKTEVAKPTEGVKCGSCYGADRRQHDCCNTCDDVKEAYRLRGWQMTDIDKVEQCKSDLWLKTMKDHEGEGCRLYGKVQVAKVAGNFHIAPGHTLKEQHSHYHDLHSMPPQRFDTSHTVHHLSFGQPFPGKTYPLDGKTFTAHQGGVMFQYYVKVVPTIYVYMDTPEDLATHQFSVTRQQKDIGTGMAGLPGFFVQYEFSPLMVKYEERRPSLSHFLVSLCAIIGGVFTVASLIDSLIYASSRALQRKIELNKLT